MISIKIAKVSVRTNIFLFFRPRDFQFYLTFYCCCVDVFYYGVPVYLPTRDCSMAGGLCVHEQDCSPDELTQRRGLCPGRGNGVECCYSRNDNLLVKRGNKKLIN